jgi:hypothetical protein
MFVFEAKLIFGTSNVIVFYVSINHVTCFLQGLHAIFTGEDDTRDACLKIPSARFSGTLHFRGVGMLHLSHQSQPMYIFTVSWLADLILCSVISALVSYISHIFLQKETGIRLRCKPLFMLLTISFSNDNTIVFLNLYCR